MLLQDAEALMKDGEPETAYRLLEQFEFEYAGKVRFDYLIGVSALDSGRADMATFALERVLAVDPDNASARLEIARAYYQLRDYPRAKTEFEAVLDQNPSPSLRSNIQKYLDEIASRAKRTRISGYIEAGTGQDSNVNNSTSDSQVFVDSFATTATLDATNVKTSDNYYAAAAGAEITHDVTERWYVHAGADLRKQDNRTGTQFDTTTTDLRTGITFETQSNRLRFSLISGQFDLGGSRNNNSTGYKGEWRHVYNPGNQLNVHAQSVKYRYTELLIKPNDIDQQALGIGWQHTSFDGQSTLSGSLHYGTEKDVATIINVPSIGIINPSGGRNDGARNFSGLRIGGQTAFSDRTIFFASAGMQTGEYGKVNHLFLRKRQDRFYEARLGANFHWDKLWTLRPQISYQRNDSNIAIYGYERMDVSLTVRRDFRNF